MRISARELYIRWMSESVDTPRDEPVPPGIWARMSPQKRATAVVAGIAVVATLVVAAFLSRPGSGDDGMADQAIDLCKTSVKHKLKDPDSAKFEDVTASLVAHENGVRRWAVSGSVNAKNGFGGYTGAKTIMCAATLPDGGNTMSANAEIVDWLPVG